VQANSPSSYLASLALHGALAAVVFFLTFWVTRNPEVPPVIFELVAGPPTNPNATVAGSSEPDLQVDLPKIKPLSPEVTRPRPEPIPEPPKVEPPPAPTAPPTPATKTPPKPEPKPPEAQKKVTYDQFVKQHGAPQPKQASKAPAPIKTPRINTADITRDLVRGGGGGTALTRPEQDLLATYLAQLRRALLLAHDRPAGLSDELEVQVTFNIAANGDISNVRVTRTSGDADVDRSAVEAFRRVGSIGPTPNRKADVWTMRFRVQE